MKEMSLLEVVKIFMETDSMEAKFFTTILFAIVIMIVNRLIKNMSYRLIKDKQRFYKVKRRLNIFAGACVILMIAAIWLESLPYLTTYIGLLSAGIAIAVKEIFTNIAGWIFIEWRKPFDVGHRISIGNQKGDVIDRRLFQFSLMEVSDYEEGEQSTGRIIDVPNSFVFIHPTINYSKGFEFIWNEIRILLTFESDWKKAKELLLEIANNDTATTIDKAKSQLKNASRKYMIHYNKLTPILYTDVRESGIQLTLRYLCEPKKRRLTTNKVWEDVLDMINEHEDIALAYPTRRVMSDK